MKRVKHYIKELILLLVMVTLVTNIVSIYKSQSLRDAPLGSLVSQVKPNKPLLLHFWATWCPTCKLEAPNIEFLSKHFEVVSVAVKSGSDADISKFMQEHGYHFKVINDANAALASKFHIGAFPSTLIYNKEHKLMFSDVGYSSTLTLYLKMLWAEKN